jgi:hypothetical protein
VSSIAPLRAPPEPAPGVLPRVDPWTQDDARRASVPPAPGAPARAPEVALDPAAERSAAPVGLAGGPRLAPEALLDRLEAQDGRTAVGRKQWRQQLEHAEVSSRQDGEELALRHLRPLGAQAPAPAERNLVAVLASVRKEAVTAQRTVRPKTSASGSFANLPHPGAWRAAAVSEAPRGARPAVPHRPRGDVPASGSVAFA